MRRDFIATACARGWRWRALRRTPDESRGWTMTQRQQQLDTVIKNHRGTIASAKNQSNQVLDAAGERVQDATEASRAAKARLGEARPEVDPDGAAAALTAAEGALEGVRVAYLVAERARAMNRETHDKARADEKDLRVLERVLRDVRAEFKGSDEATRGGIQLLAQKGDPAASVLKELSLLDPWWNEQSPAPTT